MARPRLQLDENLIYKLAEIHCTNKEIAAVVGCSTDTLERNYAALIEKGKENGKCTLRRLQVEAAKKGNVVMLIWLGKQLLGQTDKVAQTNDTTIKVEDRNTLIAEAKALLSNEANGSKYKKSSSAKG